MIARAAAFAVAALAILGSEQAARAQLCHDLPELESHHHAAGAAEHQHHDARAPQTGLGLELGLRTELASAAIERRPIDYQGASLRVDAHRGAFHVRAQGSFYRLRDTLETDYGPGDVMLAVMWTALQRPRWRLGLALPVGAPTGDHDDHLGMGHWMVMPGVFAAARPSDSVSATIGVAYNRALASGSHQHGMGPYVNPMTAEELSVAARAGLQVSSTLQLVGEGALAVPFDGSRRAVLGAGFALQRGALGLSVLAQAGALLEPFTGRGVVDLAYAF